MRKATNFYGNVNIAQIDWYIQSVLTDFQELGVSHQLVDICNEFGLEKLVKEPANGPNIHHLFFTNDYVLVEKKHLNPCVGNSSGIPVFNINTKPLLK